MAQHPGDIPVAVVQQVRPMAHAAQPRAAVQSPWPFAAWMGVSALVAVFAGLRLAARA